MTAGVPGFMLYSGDPTAPGEPIQYSGCKAIVAGVPLADSPPEILVPFNTPEPAAVGAPFVPGVFDGMPFATYRSVEALSQSGARKILRSPLHYRVDRDTPSEPTDAMQFGTAVHDGVLEPDAFADRVCAVPKVDRRTKEGKQRWAAFERASLGRIMLAHDEYARARRCVDAVLAHPAARRLLEGARREVSLFWNDGRFRVPCKARLDLLNLGGIADVKTTRDASPDEFAKSIANYGYDVQAANYYSGCEHVLDATPEFFVFIAVESEPPHAVACYQIGSASIQAGARRMEEALARYARALELGRFEGYPERITTIETPPWARRFTA